MGGAARKQSRKDRIILFKGGNVRRRENGGRIKEKKVRHGVERQARQLMTHMETVDE